MTTAIVWFRRDLRLEDNPALDTALREHARVICVYIHAPEEEMPWAPGAASRWWLHHSLTALDADLRKRGSALHIVAGATSVALAAIINSAHADAVYWNRLYEPALIARDTAIKRELLERGIDAQSFNANLLIEPWDVRTLQGGPYKVFTPFWRGVRARLAPRPPLPVPRRIESATLAGSVSPATLDLLPKIPWDRAFYTHWKPGEGGARSALRRFCKDALADYADGRDRPDRDHTSALSPHLHFGEIGPGQIVWQVLEAAQASASERVRTAAEGYIREIGWRDFSHHLLYHFPQTPQHNLNRQFDAFPWARHNKRLIARWQRGETGIPIVDAGMRQLWTTGWMHNRVRMLVASFLTKNLRQHWRHGAAWFWDTLVDADLANNTQGWQWTAGSGADAAPYFRIFNPVTQGRRFDPEGVYVRRWVPELSGFPAQSIHEPWTEPDLLRACGYPQPMLDLGTSRSAALDAYQRMRAESG
jgi:deoxyribodipyrimidine photo-lyase